MIRLFLLLILFGTLSSSGLASDFVGRHAQGWHWYHDFQWHKSKTKPITQQSPTQQMSIVQTMTKAALDKAILHPTKKNVRNYIRLQNAIADNSSHFSNVWQQVLLAHPELNYRLTHPTNQMGKQVYLDTQKAQIEKTLRQFAMHQGLFFFFRSTCPYCHRFAPIMRAFAARYHIHVIAISLDGGFLSEFPNARKDNGIAKQFHVSVVPAVFAVNPKTRVVVPVAYGLTPENILAKQVYRVAQQWQTSEN